MTVIGLFSILLVFFLVGLLLFSNDINGKRYSIASSLLLLILFFILMLSRDVAAPNDFANYTIMYESLNSFDDVWQIYHKNYTFSFLQYLGRIAGLSSEQFHAVFSLVICLIVYRAIYILFQNKRYAFIAFSLFLLSSTFIFLYANVLRQGLALSLMLLSTAYFWRRKYLSFVLVSTLAFFSHFSALIFFIALVLAKLLPLRKAVGTLHLLMLPALPVIGYVLFEAIGITSLLRSADKYSNYDYGSKVFYVKLVVSYLFIVSLFILSRVKRLKLEHEVYEGARYIYLYSVYGYLLAASFALLSIPLMSARVHYFSNAFMPLLAVAFLFLPFSLKFSFKVTIVVIFAGLIGFVSYFYPSSASQLGVYG